MHTRKPGASGKQLRPEPSGHTAAVGVKHMPMPATAIGGVYVGVGEGVQPTSFSVTGAMVSDWTQSAPAQSLPEGMDSFVSQLPSQPLAGLNGVCGVEAPLCAQFAAFAVIVAGSEQVPVGALHVQGPQLPVRPALATYGRGPPKPAGQGGASCWF